MRQKIEQVIVVEGREDESAVKAAVDAQIIVTGGFCISQETWDLLEKAYEGPVSYTHLDVYKRQGLQAGEMV